MGDTDRGLVWMGVAGSVFCVAVLSGVVSAAGRPAPLEEVALDELFRGDIDADREARLLRYLSTTSGTSTRRWATDELRRSRGVRDPDATSHAVKASVEMPSVSIVEVVEP